MNRLWYTSREECHCFIGSTVGAPINKLIIGVWNKAISWVDYWKMNYWNDWAVTDWVAYWRAYLGATKFRIFWISICFRQKPIAKRFVCKGFLRHSRLLEKIVQTLDSKVGAVPSWSVQKRIPDEVRALKALKSFGGSERPSAEHYWTLLHAIEQHWFGHIKGRISHHQNKRLIVREQWPTEWNMNICCL